VRGPEAAWDFYLKTMESFDEVPVDDTEIFDVGGDKVLVHQSYDLRGRSSGVDVEFDFWLVVTVRGRRILRVQCSGLPTAPKPSKPPGCGSRRCRRRTWRQFEPATTTSTGSESHRGMLSIPTWCLMSGIRSVQRA
jgi:hypothetical protein